MADGSALAVKTCCTLSFKLVNGSHPNITCSIECCVIRLPPQVEMLLGAPFHKDHNWRLDRRKWLVEFPAKVGGCGPASHLSVLDCQKALRRGESVIACAVRPLAGGEEEPKQLSPPSRPLMILQPPWTTPDRKLQPSKVTSQMCSAIVHPKVSLHAALLSIQLI